MKDTQKRMVMSMLFVLICGLGFLCTRTEAHAETTYYGGTEYELYTSGDYDYIAIEKSSYDGSEIAESAAIVRYKGTAASVVIPDTLGGLPVAEIGYFNKYSWTSSYIEGAFEGNSAVQTVQIPDTVQYVGTEAFRDCSGLQQVVFDEGAKGIGSRAFYNCSGLQQILLPETTLCVIDDQTFARCAALDLVELPQTLTTIGDRAFAECTGLTSIVIPDSVTTLGGGAFYGCSVMKDAVIGEGVTSLTRSDEDYYYYNYKAGAFENCTSLSSVTIGSNVEVIGADAFAETALQEVMIPDGVREIGACAFYKCGSLEHVSIGKRVKSIGEIAFGECVSLKSIQIPSNVTTLGGGAFYACTSLQTAEIGNGVTALSYLNSSSYRGGYADNYDYSCQGMFENCIGLTSVMLGDGITEIGTDAFANTALTEVAVPGGVITIGNGAFMNCSVLQTAAISDSVTTIGNSCFRYDTALKQIDIGKGVTTIGDVAFANCAALESLLIPSSVTTLGGGVCYADASLARVIVGNGVTKLSRISVSNYVSPKNYDYGAGAFENCSALTDVALGSGLTTIDTDALAGTGATSLLLPANVSTVGNGAFYDGTLTTLYFTGDAPAFGEKLFGSSETPTLYKLADAGGYDSTGYVFSEFIPVKVSFDLNGVRAITPKDQYLTPTGGYVIEPLDPMSSGYRFLGWYKDSACTERWDFLNEYVAADTTLYAGWAAVADVEPDVPNGLAVTETTGNTVTLTWNSATGAEGYYVYLDGEKITSEAVTATTYRITGLTADATYEITVSAFNANGESIQSLVKVAQTLEEDDENSPETDAPTTDAPTTEAPATDTPETEAPATDVPTTSSPETDVPTTETPSEKYNYGDVNGDGEISASDALMVLKFVVKLETPTDLQSKTADVTKNGKVEADDALLILKYVVRLIDEF